MAGKALLFVAPSDKTDPWREACAEKLPDHDFRIWSADPAKDGTGDAADVHYALVWKPPVGVLAGLPNLKAIFSLGAGVDHLNTDTALPKNVPVVRLVDRCLTQGMSEYVLYWVIHYHRKMGVYRKFHEAGTWKQMRQADAEARRVGILGLGELGGDAAGKLAMMHYQVAGWSRREKNIPGIECFHGPDQLVPFLNRTEILICLLPLTDGTRGILNAAAFGAMPKGSFLINCARGGHLVDADLLAALDSGQIEGATLDVFHTEPLPEAHPFWTHPKINITPHAASLTVASSSLDWISMNVRNLEAGRPLQGIVDPATGY